MRINIYYTVAYSLIALLTACHSSTTSINPNSPENPTTGDVTEIGVSTGDEAVSKAIGPEGGVLTSNNGRLTLTIPAGAFDKATSLTILPVINKTPNGMGVAYRLLPQDLRLSKPGTIRINYTEAELAGNTTETIGMARQKADMIWYTAVGQSVSASNRQISAPITVLGDWSLYRHYALSFNGGADEPVAYYGTSAKVSLSRLVAMEVDNEEPLRKATVVTTGTTWTLDGHGTLAKHGLDGVYTAPSYHPEQNPVTVTVSVPVANNATQITLTQPVYVGMGYIKFTFNGQSSYCTTVGLQDPVNSYSTILSASETMPMNLTFRTAGSGVLPFGDFVALDGRSGIALSQLTTSNRFDTGHGDCGGQRQFANGQIILAKYVKGKVVKGTFSGNLISTSANCTTNGPAISGEFLIKTPAGI